MKLENLYTENLLRRITAVPLGGKAPEVSVEAVNEMSADFSAKKEGEGLYRISFRYDLEEACSQEDLQVCLQLPENPDFCWSPHLTPEEGYIVQQHVFRTPGLIFCYARATAVLFPDPEALKSYSGCWYLDMDAPAGRMYIGLCGSRVAGHILYQKDGAVEYGPGRTEISFYLLLKQEAMENPFRPVLDFYWKNYGRKDAAEATPAKKDPERYIAHTYDWVFDRWKKVMWQEFELDGKKVGAPVFIVNVAQSPNYPGQVNERELRSIWNQAWFCSLRSASGLYRYGKRCGRQDLVEYADRTKELALSFPQQDGLFDAVIATEMEQVEIEGKKYSRSRGWETKYFGNSDRNPFGRPVKTAPRHLLDMSFTAEYMLVWYEELEADPRLLEYALGYGRRLVKLQDEAGFFPGWVDAEGRPMGVLDQGPESAMSAVFLLHLAGILKRQASGKGLEAAQAGGSVSADDPGMCGVFADAALKAIGALEQEVIPTGRWEDFETYWSCSRFWSDRVGQKISRSNMYKQCNFSMFWTAWALLAVWEFTGKREYLETGRRVLDELLMTQSSYQPAHISVPVVGGFGVMNADAELDDARQSLFAEVIFRYGKALGETEYLERGRAAMQMSFSMMYCPENPETKAQWEKTWPFFGEEDYGFMMENYGHNGKTDDQGLGIGEFTIYDWGNGAAAECYERMRAHFGEEI